jgi:hypothetical protein
MAAKNAAEKNAKRGSRGEDPPEKKPRRMPAAAERALELFSRQRLQKN